MRRVRTKGHLNRKRRYKAIPSTPWAKVGIDLFAHANETYLIIVDYYSYFFEFTKLVDQKSETTINACKEQLSRYGCPQIVQSDGGPQFISAEFEQFATTWGFQHYMSSPYHTQSNGKAEAAVKIAKSVLRKSKRSDENNTTDKQSSATADAETNSSDGTASGNAC